MAGRRRAYSLSSVPPTPDVTEVVLPSDDFMLISHSDVPSPTALPGSPGQVHQPQPSLATAVAGTADPSSCGTSPVSSVDFNPILNCVIQFIVQKTCHEKCLVVPTVDRRFKIFDFGLMKQAHFKVRKHCFLRAFKAMGIETKQILELLYEMSDLESHWAEHVLLMGEMFLQDLKKLLRLLISRGIIAETIVLINMSKDVFMSSEVVIGECFSGLIESSDPETRFINFYNSRMVEFKFSGTKTITHQLLTSNFILHGNEDDDDDLF